MVQTLSPMRVLFSTVSPAAYMAPPLLSDEQINCGPEWRDARAPDGRVVSLATPLGEYDLAAVVAKLPPEQMPEVVVCLVDASWRNVPKNLQSFSCPKILLIADTHHMSSPIIGMLRYASAEPFDRIVLLYDRHHARIFQAAGLTNVYWFPGLTFPHSDEAVRRARTHGRRARDIAFVGQAGRHHPRRARMLEAVAAHRLPLMQKAARQAEALALYGTSMLGLNCSLNGDLNLRVFEVIASGAALLTDRLAPESGLLDIFRDEGEVLVYDSSEELVHRAAHAISHETETRAIGAAGARWFDRHLNADRRREAFCQLAFDGLATAAFELPPPNVVRVLFGGDVDRLLDATLVYEGIQELHRTQETVRVRIDGAVPPDVCELFTTLPRVSVERHVEGERADLGISTCPAPVPTADSVWYWNATLDDIPRLAAEVAPSGYAQPNPAIAFFRWDRRPFEAFPKNGREMSSLVGSSMIVTGGFETSTASDRIDGLVLVARIALKAGDVDLSDDMIASARRINAADARVRQFERERVAENHATNSPVVGRAG